MLVLIIELYFLIPAIAAQNFNPAPELAMPTRIAANEVNVEIETQPAIVEAKISKCLT